MSNLLRIAGKNPSGNAQPFSVTDTGDVKVQESAEMIALIEDLEGKDFSTENTLAAVKAVLDSILAKVIAAPATEYTAAAAKLVLDAIAGKDFATQTTSAAILAKLSDLATAAKQDSAKAVLDSIAAEDFATQDTLAQVLGAVDGLEGVLGTAADNTVDAGASGSVSAKLKRLTSTTGQTDDAVVAAGAAGTMSAKLRRLTTDLDALKTELMATKTLLGDGSQKAQISASFASVKSAPVVGAKTVTSTAAEVFAGASRLAGRYTMQIHNDSANTIYWGGSGVLTTNGMPIYAGDTTTLVFDKATATAVYLIAAQTSTVRVVEIA